MLILNSDQEELFMFSKPRIGAQAQLKQFMTCHAFAKIQEHSVCKQNICTAHLTKLGQVSIPLHSLLTVCYFAIVERVGIYDAG